LETETQQPIKEHQSNFKLVMMGLIYFIFNCGIFTALFAPVPLIVAALSFGRSKAYGVGALCLGCLFLASMMIFQSYQVFSLGIFSYFVAIGISEMIIRGFHPMKSILILGSSMCALFAITMTLSVKQGFSPSSYIESSLSETKKIILENKEYQKNKENLKPLIAFLDAPKESASIVLKTIPLYAYAGIFLSIWGIFYFILKSYHYYSQPKYLKYSEDALKNFRMSDYFIFPVAIFLALYVFANDLGGHWGYIGQIGLFAFGVFYFMQGFGVLMSYLDNFKVFGFFRTFIVVTIFVLAPFFLCSLGLFDTWFDFRKKTKNKLSNKKL